MTYNAEGKRTSLENLAGQVTTTAWDGWPVTYNGKNRLILWENVSTNSPTHNSSTPTLISMSYDRIGRRVTKNGQRFVYNGYLQIANFELQTSNIKHQTFIWDPTEPVATRPIVWNSSTIQPFNFSTSYYTHDGNKNVSEVLASDGALRQVTASGQPGYGMTSVDAATPGSKLLAKAIMKKDECPLWVTVWGGANTLLRALSDAKAQNGKAEFNKALGRLKVYEISDQDDASAVARREFPEVEHIVDPCPAGDNRPSATSTLIQPFPNPTRTQPTATQPRAKTNHPLSETCIYRFIVFRRYVV